MFGAPCCVMDLSHNSFGGQVWGWRQGPRARRFFRGSQWTTLRHSSRSLVSINMQLGMYERFAQVHAKAWSWNPWETEPEQGSVAKPPKR